jgi:uncharacterized cupin superfamily protein
VSSFTIVNLMDVEETSSARLAGIEGRFARSSLESEELGVSHFRYAPGVESPLAHRHREQEEVYIVTGGSGLIMVDGEVHELRLWDVVRVSPSALRSLAAGLDGLEVIAVGSRRPEGGDGITVDANWPD